MKLVVEVILSVILHPVAIILAWINLASRTDMDGLKKILWALLIFFAWGIGPVLYILLADGALW